MYQDTSKPKKNIKITEAEKVSPPEFPRLKTGETGETISGETSGETLLGKLDELMSSGWKLRIKKVKNSLYLTARKTEKGRRKEICITKITEKEAEKLKEKGYIGKKAERKKTKRTHEKPATSTTTQQQPQRTAEHGPMERYGGFLASVGSSFGFCFMVHRLGLRFVRPWVSPLFLQQLGRVRFVERSKQWVVRLEVGVGRVLTLQVNRDGTAQVFLEASDNPLSVEEFVGFCRFFLPEVMRRATGRWVSLGDFEVMASPEVNVDLPGVNVLEGAGVNGRSLTLQDYYDSIVRIYWCPPGRKESMPEGGTRVEARAGEWKGRNLREIVDAMSSMARLPIALAEIRKELEAIKGSLPLKPLEMNQFAEVVATKLANLIYLSFEKWGGRFELALKELGTKLQEALEPVFKRLDELEKENRELKSRLQKQQSGNDDGKVRFEDLPEDLRSFLRELEKKGYVRLTETRIAYGYEVWKAIKNYKGNIDWWIKEESFAFSNPKDKLFRAVISAIMFYDNKYNGKPGVPYSLFLGALEMYLH